MKQPTCRQPIGTFLGWAAAACTALPAWAQTAQSAGAAPSPDVPAGDLQQTNGYVIAAVVLALVAIVVALIFRQKPADLGG